MPSSTIFMPMYLREVEELHAKKKNSSSVSTGVLHSRVNARVLHSKEVE
jgi:hypothetical protein